MDMERNCSSSSSNGIAASLAGLVPMRKALPQFPVGYRFRPTDEELLLHYLKPKILSLPLPASSSDVVPVCDVFLTHPSLLPGDLTEKRYFFSSRKDVHSSSRSYLSCINASRRRGVVHVHVVGTGSGGGGGGCWKVNNGKDKVILATSNGQLKHEQQQQAIGLRRSMVFYQGKQADPHSMVQTPWVMHQFHLLATYYSPQECRTSVMEMGDWVVCRIFQKKKKNSKAEMKDDV